MRRTQSVRHEHLFTAEWHPGGCKKRCVKEKTHKPTDPPPQPEAQEIVVMAVSAKAERARAPERAAQKHISTCGTKRSAKSPAVTKRKKRRQTKVAVRSQRARVPERQRRSSKPRNRPTFTPVCLWRGEQRATTRPIVPRSSEGRDTAQPYRLHHPKRRVTQRNRLQVARKQGNSLPEL